MNKKMTSWENVAKWYDTYLEDEGHYYHKEIILPYLKPKLKKMKGLLDVGCGQGVLSRQIPKGVKYVGIDNSKSLISEAKKRAKDPNHHFHVQDATQPFELGPFSHAVQILSLQNMEDPAAVVQNVGANLNQGGTYILVLNHPCFRIPRQSSWEYDEGKKLQYRRVDRYMEPLEIPIQMKPSQKEKSPTTLSFHHSLADITKWLKASGLCIIDLDELISQKTSTGGRAKAENRCRKEFPLFMALHCRKL